MREKIAKAHIGIVLAPGRCIPNLWDTHRCVSDAPRLLYEAGVTDIGISTADPDNVFLYISHIYLLN